MALYTLKVLLHTTFYFANFIQYVNVIYIIDHLNRNLSQEVLNYLAKFELLTQ